MLLYESGRWNPLTQPTLPITLGEDGRIYVIRTEHSPQLHFNHFSRYMTLLRYQPLFRERNATLFMFSSSF